MAIMSVITYGQTYSTTGTGNYVPAATNPAWGTAVNTPPQTGNCGCEIIINSGHTLTINGDVNIDNATIILMAGSTLTFGNNRTLILGGANSSIDIQSNTATIFKTGNPNSTITLGGQIIYRSNTTSFPTGQPAGTVRGPASASALRSNPQFLAGTLPVKLSAFTGEKNGGRITLSWATALEINSGYFQVERSNDTKLWNTIGVVGASGNSGTEKKYMFADQTPANGNNYYRLKIVDIDGKYEYSPIRNISAEITGLQVSAAPNPAYNILNIGISQPSAKEFSIKLINRSGQVVFSRKYSGSVAKIPLEVSRYPEGSYFVETTDALGTKAIKSIVIVRR